MGLQNYQHFYPLLPIDWYLRCGVLANSVNKRIMNKLLCLMNFDKANASIALYTVRFLIANYWFFILITDE